jgi:hypothetical protein
MDAMEAARRAYKAECAYPFSDDALESACKAYAAAQEREDGFEAYVSDLHEKYPEEWTRGFEVGYSGEKGSRQDYMNAPFQAGWMYGNTARMAIEPKDDGTSPGVNPSVILTSPGARYRRAIVITDARARSARQCDL